MIEAERVERWLGDLGAALESAARLAERGRDAFDHDEAVRLAFEALSIRVGEIAKRLVTADPVRFADPIWSDAAQNRDFVAHHYDVVDAETLWATITTSLPRLALLISPSTRRA